MAAGKDHDKETRQHLWGRARDLHHHVQPHHEANHQEASLAVQACMEWVRLVSVLLWLGPESCATSRGARRRHSSPLVRQNSAILRGVRFLCHQHFLARPAWTFPPTVWSFHLASWKQTALSYSPRLWQHFSLWIRAPSSKGPRVHSRAAGWTSRFGVWHTQRHQSHVSPPGFIFAPQGSQRPAETNLEAFGRFPASCQLHPSLWF